MTQESKFTKIIADLEDSKASDITVIELGKDDICDQMIIVSGTSTRHVSSIAEKLMLKLKSDLKLEYRVEGLKEGNWVLLDIIGENGNTKDQNISLASSKTILVHIFLPETRSYYNLEALWQFKIS